MNQEYVYSVSTGRLKEFFTAIQRMGVPTRVNTKVLPMLGFKSTNDRAIVSILKALGLVDASGTPTAYWQAMRNPDKARLVMADRIRETYADLYETYPDAQSRTDDEIRNFIQGRSKAGPRAVAAMVSTFKVLSSLADFSGTAPVRQDNLPFDKTSERSDTSYQNRSGATTLTTSLPTSSQVKINLTINLPDTADYEYIDNIFESMARHLLGRSAVEDLGGLEFQEDISEVDEDEDKLDEVGK